jgi:hypothetical protein
MRFGLSGTFGGLEAHGADAVLARARRVERLGFDCMWFNEEHFGQPDARHGRRVLSPIVLAAAVAAATTSLRVGFSVLLVPLHHPLRLAEEIATLDVLSAGRVNFGVSRANNDRYRIPFGYDEHRDPGLQQCLERIIGYWSGTPIVVDDVSYTLAPAPVQQPHPPIYVGAGAGPARACRCLKAVDRRGWAGLVVSVIETSYGTGYFAISPLGWIVIAVLAAALAAGLWCAGPVAAWSNKASNAEKIQEWLAAEVTVATIAQRLRGEHGLAASRNQRSHTQHPARQRSWPWSASCMPAYPSRSTLHRRVLTYRTYIR